MDQTLARKVIGSKRVSVQDARKLYDSFPVKDISFENFHKELNEVLDPFSAMTQLEGIRTKKRVGVE